MVKDFKDSKTPAFLDIYAWLNFLNGQFDEALKASETAVEMNAKVPEFYYHLGMVYAEKGRNEEAIIALEKAVTEGNEFYGLDKAREKAKTIKSVIIREFLNMPLSTFPVLCEESSRW